MSKWAEIYYIPNAKNGKVEFNVKSSEGSIGTYTCSKDKDEMSLSKTLIIEEINHRGITLDETETGNFLSGKTNEIKRPSHR
jgi:hypothetical protein